MLQCNICMLIVFMSEMIRYFNGQLFSGTLGNNALLSEIKRT